jgi:pyridoxamine 5'-phosphate oxidase
VSIYTYPMRIEDIRKSYEMGELSEANADSDPLTQFTTWFNEALDHDILEPNAMTLATVNASGQPSARIVLIKGFDARGIAWYTNYASRKGDELATNPKAALLFHWVALERQVRIEGTVSRVSEAESDAYFASRPYSSRIGAVASEQSRVITSAEALKAREDAAKAQYPQEVPRPADWGGFRLKPHAWEFWQGRPSRLHDRLRYVQDAKGAWLRERLSP